MDMRNRHCGGVRQRHRTTAVACVFAREGFVGANRKRRLPLAAAHFRIRAYVRSCSNDVSGAVCGTGAARGTANTGPA